MNDKRRTERTHFVVGNEPIGLTYCGANVHLGEVPKTDRVTLEWRRVTCPKCRSVRIQAAPRRGT